MYYYGTLLLFISLDLIWHYMYNGDYLIKSCSEFEIEYEDTSQSLK